MHKTAKLPSAGRMGVTLVELLVVISILAMVTGLIYGIFISQIRAKTWQDQVFEAQQSVRGAMDLMVAEMRKAEVANAINGLCVNAIAFKAYNNEIKKNELISYYLDHAPSEADPASLIRGSKPDGSSTTATVVVADNVANFSLECYDQSGQGMSNIVIPAGLYAIRKAKLTVTGITGRPNPNTGEKVTRTLVSSIEFRNAWRYSGTGCGILNFGINPSVVAFCDPPGETGELTISLMKLGGAPLGGTVTISPKIPLPVNIIGIDGTSVTYLDDLATMNVPVAGVGKGRLFIINASQPEAAAGSSIEMLAKWQPEDCHYSILTSRALGIEAGLPYKMIGNFAGGSMLEKSSVNACQSSDSVDLRVKIEDNCTNPIEGESVAFSITGVTSYPDTDTGKGDITQTATEIGDGYYTGVYNAGNVAQSITIEANAPGVVNAANRTKTEDLVIAPNIANHIALTSKNPDPFTFEECPGRGGTIAFQVQDRCNNPRSGEQGNLSIGLMRDGESEYSYGIFNVVAAGGTYSTEYSTADSCGEGGLDMVKIAHTNTAIASRQVSVNLSKCELPAISLQVTEEKLNDAGLSGLPGGCNDTDSQVKVTATVILADCEPSPIGTKVTFYVESPTVGRNAMWFESGDDTYETSIQNVPSGAGGEFIAHLRGGNAKVGDTLTIKAVAAMPDYGGSEYTTDPGSNASVTVIGSDALVRFFNSIYTSEVSRYTVPKLLNNETGSLYLEVRDCNRNHDSGINETVSANLKSDTPAGILNSIDFILPEVNPASGAPDPNSGVFRVSIPMKRTPEAGMLRVEKGSFVNATYVDADNVADSAVAEAALSGCRQMKIKNLAGNEIGEVDPKKPYPDVFPDDPPHTFHVEVSVPFMRDNGIINSGASSGFKLRTCADEAKETTDEVMLSESADDGVLKVSQTGIDYVYVLEGTNDPVASGLSDPLGVWVTRSPQHMKVYYPDISSTCDDTLDDFIDEGCMVEVYLADVDQPSVVLVEPGATSSITPAIQNAVPVNFTASDGLTGFINSSALYRESADSFGTCNPTGGKTLIKGYNTGTYPSINWGGEHNIGVIDTVDLSGLGDGVYSVYATATDNETNIGTSDIKCITKDITSPYGVFITSPADGSTVAFTPVDPSLDVLNDPYTLAYTFTANDLTTGLDNAVVYLKETATSTQVYSSNFEYNGDTSVAGAGAFDATDLNDGWYNIYVTAWDIFRNSSTSDTGYAVLLNRLGAWLWDPSGNALINGGTVSFGFDYWDGLGGTVTNAILFVNSVSASSYTPNVRQGTITGTFDTTGFADGDYEVKVWVKDNDGNTAFSNTSTVSIDNTLPGVTLDLPLNGAYIGNTLNYQFTATDNRALVNSTVYLTETADGTLYTYSHGFANLASVTQTGSFNTSGYDDGPYTIYVRVWDAHGNTIVSATHNVMIDRLKALLYLPADNAIVNGPAVPFQFEYWDGPTGSLADFKIYASDGFVDNLVFDSPVGQIGNHATISGTFDSTAIPDGVYDFYVQVIDNDGNTYDSPMNLNIRIKNNPPDAPVLIEPVNGAEFVMNTVPYHFTASDPVLGINNAVIHLYNTTTSSDRDTDIYTYTDLPLVNTTGFFNTTTYNDGPYEVWVDVFDRLGNMNSSTPNHSIMVDRMRAFLNSPDDGDIINGPAHGYDFFYYDGLGGTITNAILIINSASGTQTNVASYTPNANSGHQAGAFNTGAYADGLYDLRVQVRDNNNNIKYSSRNGVRIKNTPPAIVLDIPVGNVTVTNSLDYQATATDNVIGIGEISVILTNTATGATTLSAMTSYAPAYPIGSTIMNGTFNTSGVDDGRYRIHATTEDQVGNPATSVVRDVMVNRLTATMLTPVTGDILNGTAADMRVNGADGTYSFYYWDGTGGRVVSATVYAKSQATAIATAVNTHVFAPQKQTDTVADKFDTTALADGLYDIYVTVTDNDGNTFTSAMNTGVRIKNALPTTITLNTPLDGAKVGNTVSYDFTANDIVLGIRNVTAYFYEVSASTVRRTTPYNYAPVPNTTRNESATFNATALNDGYYDVYADAYDAVWNTKRSNVNRVMLDRLSGTLTSPATGTIINGTAVTFSINGAASTYAFTYDDGPGGTVTNATVRLVDSGSAETAVGSFTPNLNSGTVNSTFDTTAHADGVYSIYVQLRDNHANIVNTNTNTNVRIKNTLPTVVLNTPAADVEISNSLAYEATGYDAVIGISEVSVWLTNTATGAVTLSSATAYANTSPAVKSGTFNTSGVDDGRYKIRATAKDAIGNPATSATRNVMVNRLTATMLTPAAGSIVNGTMPFSFYYYDGAGGTVTDAVVYARPTSGPDYILGTYTPGNRTGTINDSIDTNGAADGLYDIFVWVQDNDGNIYNSPMNAGVRVKNNKPYIVLNSPADGAKVGSSADYDFTANDVTFGIDNAIAYFTNATSTLTQAYDYSPAVPNTPINQSGTFNAAALNDGLYDVYVRVFDPIGNTNASAYNTVMLDRLAGTMVDPAAGAVINGAGADMRINGVVAPYRFTYADGPGGTVTNAATILVDSGSAKSTVGMHALGANSGTATGTFDTTAYADGLYSIYAQMRDDNGNIVNTTANLNVRIKNTKPGITLDIPAGNVEISNSLAYQATGSDAVIGIANITVYLVNTATGNTTISSGTDYGNPLVPTAKAGTLDTTGVADGRYYINASADDAVGNRQFSVSRDVMVNRLNAILNTPAESAVINGPSVPVTYFYFDGVGGTVTNAAIYARDAMANVYEIDAFNPGNRTGWASRTIDTTGATDGLYDIFVKVWDNDGNVYSSASHSVRVKNNSPTVTLNTPLDGAIFNAVTSDSVDYDFTADDETLGIANATVYFYDLTALSVALTNSFTYAPIPNNPVNQAGTLDTSGLNDGPYSVYVTVGDPIGNMNTSAPAHSVMLDRLTVTVDFPPTGTWVQGIGGHASNVNSSYQFTVTDGPGGGADNVKIYLKNTGTGIINQVASHSFGPTVGPYSDLANYDSSYYPNGNYDMYAVATDNHGNTAESARSNIDIWNACQISSTNAYRYSYYNQANDYINFYGYFYINWWAVDATMRLTASSGAYDSGDFANNPANGYYWKQTPYVIPKAGIANGVAVGTHGVCTATKNYYLPLITMSAPTDYSVVKGPTLTYAFNAKTNAGSPSLYVQTPFNTSINPGTDGRCTQIDGTKDFNCSFSQSSTSMADGDYYPYVYVYNDDLTERTYKYFTYTLDNCWHTITVGGPSATATINANSCDTDANGRYEEYYMFTLASPAILNIQMTFASGTVDPYIEFYSDADGNPATPGVFISSDDNGGGAPNARIATSMLAAGAYYVKATTAGVGQTGTATVSVAESACMHDLALSTPTVGTLSAAASCDASTNVTGALAPDARLEEWYKIVTASAMPLVITHDATTMSDPFMTLYDSGLNMITYNDDFSGFNSQIDSGVLPAGTYYAVATSFGAGDTGGFTITASPSPCYTLQTLTLGAWAADSLTCDMDADGLYDEYFEFTLTGNDLYEIDMVDTSGGMIDPYIYLMDASFNILDQNDDGGGFPNARLVKSLNAGTYYIKATDVSWGTGSFDIRVNEINYIVNGGFETGSFAGWVVQMSNLYPQISAVVKDTGAFSAYMGDGAGGMWTGVNPSVSAISQNITVPVGAVSPTLAFRYYIPGYDGPDYDGMEVLINGVKQGASIKGNTGGWVNYSLNLAPWANGALTTVRIQVYTRDAGVTVNYYVDNVRAYWQ